MVVHEAIKEVLGQPGLGEALPQKEEDIWNGQKKIISLVDLLCLCAGYFESEHIVEILNQLV